MNLFALAFGAIAGGFCFFRSITSLSTALHLLVVTIVCGGIIAANLGGGGYAVLFRDLCIVLPIYISVFTTQAGREALVSIPADLWLTISFLVLVTAVCTLNPVAAPLGQIIVGLKVWLFYIPFIAVGILIAHRTDLLLGLIRKLLLWGAFACAVGLLQSVLVRLIGYEPAIHLFFGDAAGRVTQGFTRFEEAGGIYRIPGTFSFSAQYGGFLCLYLTISAIAVNADPDRRVRQFAAIAIFVAVIAGILSGSRALILILPAMLAAYAICGILRSKILLIAPAALAVGAVSLQLAAVNALDYFTAGERLASQDASEFTFQQISDALGSGVMGLGIGISTMGARYLVGGTAIDDVPLISFEVYFAKAAAELGWLGFAAVCMIFLAIIARAASTALVNLKRPENAIVAPIATYLAYTIISSFKGSALDVDPGNIFFWALLGVMIGVNNLRRYADMGHESIFVAEDVV